jgi:aspartyl-tRNA(Asn)/glutamyl-tRNA(Gln) amidotransferase subunit A
MDYQKLTIREFVKKIKSKEFTAAEAAEYFLNKCKKDEKNALLEVYDDALSAAKIIDEKIANGAKLGKLCGVPIVIKDNILYKGHKSSTASKLMENFISPYNATVVSKLLAEDAIILGRANQDEFAMGTTGSNSAFSMTKNGFNDDYVSGGSSAGSASAVASGICLAALGTDTGGSVRCPAAFNGIVGLKPTYGTISRYGLIAFASSIEQCGPLTKDVGDCELLYSVIAGKDINDATTVEYKNKPEKCDLTTLKIGRVKEVWELASKLEDLQKYEAVFEYFKGKGAAVVDVSIKNIGLSLAGYYTVATAEAASNLARFDGVKYGVADTEAEDLIELYKNTRSKYFGREVKRRIITGNYNLGNENYDIYKMGAQVLADVKAGFAKCFTECDCVIMPITMGSAPKLDEKFTDPTQLYLLDLFSVPANVAGVPAISVPCGKAKNGMPIGIQFVCKKGDDYKMFSIAKIWEARK